MQWKSRPDGTGRGKGSPCRPRTANLPVLPDRCSSSEEQRSGLAGPGPNPLHTRHGAVQDVRYDSQEAGRPVEMRGERLHVRLATNLQSHALSALHRPSWGHLHHAPRGHSEQKRRASTLPARRGGLVRCRSIDCPQLRQRGELLLRKTCLVLSEPPVRQRDVLPGGVCGCHQER